MESTFNLSVLDVSVSKADCEARHIGDTIGFSRVVFQLQPKTTVPCDPTPPASAAWFFNFNLKRHHTFRSNLKHHAAEAGGILQRVQRRILRSNLKHPAAEAGGIA